MKEDRRIRKSKNALKKAMIELMHKKSVSSITICELCKKADVNRSTFYGNYAHIIDLVTELHYDLFEAMHIKEKMPVGHEFKNKSEHITAMIRYVETNKKMVTVLFTNNENNLLEKNLTQYFIKEYQIQSNDYKECYPFLYHTLGSFTLLKYWVHDDFPCSAKELADIITCQSESLHI